MSEMNQLHYAVLGTTLKDSKDYYHTLAETLPYIDIIISHKTYYYEDGKEKSKKVKMGVKDCTAADFAKDAEQEKYFAGETKKGLNFLCLDDEAMKLEIVNNIQSRKIYKQKNSFMTLEVKYCKDSPKRAVPCAPMNEIKTWLYNKQLEPLAFNNKVALADFGRYYRPAFSQYPAVHFKPGIKSDLWFRFTENQFTRKDRWYHFRSTKDTFYALDLIYANSINVPDDKLTKNRIARLLYRNKEVYWSHEREVIQFEEFLGNIAGIYDLLMFFIITLLGGYIEFAANVKWIKKFYRFTDVDKGPKSSALEASPMSNQSDKKL